MSRRLLADPTLERAARAFDLDTTRLRFVRDVANIVYAHERDGRVRFLRLTHEADRGAPDVDAELDWLAFLAARGLPVCRPVQSVDGRLRVAADDHHSAAVFERVRGEPCSLEAFREPVFEQAGAFLGRLHAVGHGYRPRAGAPQRLHWHQLDPPDRVLASWPGEDRSLAERFETLHGRMRECRVPEERYGLIHGDVHRGNIHLHPGGIDVFDFDDCCRAFLAMDVAHALYYALWDRRYLPETERSAFARDFLVALLRGYRGERSFDEDDLALIPDLLELRELAVDAFSHRRHTEPDAETRRRWAWVRQRIEQGRPYVELELAELYDPSTRGR